MVMGAGQSCWPPFTGAGGPVGWSVLPCSFFGGPVRTAVVACVGALEEGLDDDDELLLDDDEVGVVVLELDDDEVGVVVLELDDDELDDDEVGVVVLELDDEVGVEVLELDDDVVDVGGGVSQPVTQKTLCLTSAPCEPSALMVSLTCHPWMGCGSMPVKSSV